MATSWTNHVANWMCGDDWWPGSHVIPVWGGVGMAGIKESDLTRIMCAFIEGGGLLSPEGQWGNQPSRFPEITTSWCLGLHVIPSPWVWAWPSDSLLMNRIWQMWWDIPSDIILLKSVIPPFSLAHSDEASSHVISCPMERLMWQETEDHLWPIASKELRPSIQ